MNSNVWFTLLKDLQILKAVGPKDIHVGICGNIPFSHDRDDLLRTTMMQWPKFSGRTIYPVPDPQGGSPYEAYHRIESLWDHQDPYCQLRWELLDWCINHLMDCMSIQHRTKEKK